MKTKPKKLLNPDSFYYVNENIEKLFKPEPIRGKIELKHFDRYITSDEVIEELKKDGCVPANATELFDWYEQNKDSGIGKYQGIVALGSQAVFDGRRLVCYVWWNDSERSARLPWFDSDWIAGCWFAFVRESTKSSDTENSSLSNLDLERAIKVVKEAGYQV